MRILTSLLDAAKRFGKRVLQATAPHAPLRVNPMAMVQRQRDQLSGLHIRYAKTRQSSAISYRAGRSKYAPKELRDACVQARRRLLTGWLPGDPYAEPII